ncbi:rho guanine nucleotide exchange factor 10-like protein isoform X2 [Anopheles moucheti]|uniref:rho guanine nucleotide exchange factor 10-like protein isoform X2 n=1 Tax=Anopheles moucheti TaxID=186751 RepID=UPI0022F08FFB|nr:rho guanine nucleotide exchange factor 10-like protein isoform X2 [Anopheles moucheti]
MHKLRLASSFSGIIDRMRNKKRNNDESQSIVIYSVLPKCLVPPFDDEQVALQPMPDNLSRCEQKRWLAFEEFIKHEQNYLDVSCKLQYEIYNKLLMMDDITDTDTLYAMFGTHQRICQLHQFIQPLMDACVKEWADERLTGWMIWALLEQPLLNRLYSVFIAQYPYNKDLAKTYANQNIHFASFTSKLWESGCPLNFVDYYLMMVQRLPQLVLEVKDLLKNTDETHLDFPMLEKCVTLVTALGEQINAAVGRYDTAQVLLQATMRLHTGDKRVFQHGTYQCELMHIAPLNEMCSTAIKPRVILLLSDRLVCAKRPKKQNEAGTSKMTLIPSSNEQYGELKWVVPLQNVQLDDEEFAHAGSLRAVATGSMHLMENIRDFGGTIANLRGIVGTFLQSNEHFTVNACNEQMDKIWSAVLHKKAAPAVENVLRVKVKDSEKVYVLTLDNADAKNELCNAIRLAQLALRPENSPAWWNSTLYAPYEPLYVKTFNAGDQDTTVTSGCCYVPNINSPAYANELFRAWSEKQHVVWISTIDKQSNSKITLYTHDRARNAIDLRASFTLPSVRVTCIAHVPEGMIIDKPADTVWIATNTHILIYSATFPMIKEQLMRLSVFDTPNRILYHAKRVFVITDDNQLLVFSMTANGVWNLKNPQQWFIGSVQAMTAANAYVYIAFGAYIHVFDCNEGTFVKQIGEEYLERRITLLEYSVHGLWVCHHRTGIITLYHAETYMHLLDIDIDGYVDQFQRDDENEWLTARVCVTSLAVVDNMLWVGTNVGVLLSLQLPKHANVPIIDENIQVAYHAHLQNVKLILPLPPLRACEEITASLDVKPTTVENLFVNTRKPSEDLVDFPVADDAMI